ncbi:hypothetical protein DEI82_14385 [Curtobacterium sp. MCBD17_019]|nr:hypothetical protein DEI82_14385 [Curtobacterium sp. MCBD17_019]
MPGAQDAYDIWQKLNEIDGEPLRRSAREADKALLTMRASGKKRADVATADYEAAEQACRDAHAALTAHERRALTALRRFDGLMTAGSDKALRARAAAVALDKHSEATAHAAALFAAIRDRDSAARRAGLPRSHSWLRHQPQYIDGGLTLAETTIGYAISAFNTGEMQRVVDGQEATPADVERPDGNNATFKGGDVHTGREEWA